MKAGRLVGSLSFRVVILLAVFLLLAFLTGCPKGSDRPPPPPSKGQPIPAPAASDEGTAPDFVNVNEALVKEDAPEPAPTSPEEGAPPEPFLEEPPISSPDPGPKDIRRKAKNPLLGPACLSPCKKGCRVWVKCGDIIEDKTEKECMTSCFKMCEEGSLSADYVPCFDKFETDCGKLKKCLDDIDATGFEDEDAVVKK